MIADRFSPWITVQLHIGTYRESVTAATERPQNTTSWSGESPSVACWPFANESDADPDAFDALDRDSAFYKHAGSIGAFLLARRQEIKVTLLTLEAVKLYLDLGGSRLMVLPSVSVVVPALNEARNIPHVFARMPSDIHEIILVDGFSIDDTVAVARRLRPEVRVVRQSRMGKGNAVACGIAVATGEIIAMVDADGSADPSEIPRFVDALLNGADFAKGTRFAEGGGSADITRLRSLGNYALTAFFNACYGSSYSDLCYGFNVFWRRHAAVIGLDATSPQRPGSDGRLWGDGFEVETLIHVRVAKANLVVAEVPSYEHSRIHGVSNLNAFHDGRRVLRTILKERRLTSPPRVASAIPPSIFLPPTTATRVAHERTAAPVLAAGSEHRIEGATGEWESIG